MSKKLLHPNCIAYRKMIVEHQNYKNLPGINNDLGDIRWVVAGKSELGEKRKKWWLDKKQKLLKDGIKLDKRAELQPTCLHIHPTKKKADQKTGILWDIRYVYPSTFTLKKINKIFNKNYVISDTKEGAETTIFKIIDDLYNNENFMNLENIIPGISKNKSIQRIKEFIEKEYVDKFDSRFSPGVMSNCPDRFDGFHDYCLGNRNLTDKGRSKENLQTYGRDRRAYEKWADGDWKAANRLMKKISAQGKRGEKSPDHVGPVSLGFCHRPRFNIMTQAQNSAKGNRLTLNDFKQLIQEEKIEQVVSWHTKPLWDLVKNKIKNENDVEKLSKLMRRNIDCVLIVLYEVLKLGHIKFLLSLLNPQYAYFKNDMKFENFNKETGEYSSLIKTPANRKENENNANRYIEISFEALEEYKDKKNRRLANMSSKDLATYVEIFKKNPNKETLVNIYIQIAKKLISNTF
jgi:Alw26I/Eco31I/Esp3I family type II restriction endonuclease